MDQRESLERRRKSVLAEAETRGFEAVVFLNEVIKQNPSNTIYVLPMALGDEHQTFVMDTGGDTTLVTPHWGAPRIEASGEFSRVIAIKQEKGHHIAGTREALKPYKPDKVCFDLSTVSAQMAYRMSKKLGVPLTPERDISDHVFRLRSIKDDYEIAEIKRAITLTEAGVQMMIEETHPGRSVEDLKRELDANLIELGAYEYSFDSSIGFVKQNKTDHLKHGDALSIDVGIRLRTGYCSDMGRNWHVTWEKDTEDYMDRAMQAQVEGIKNIKAGATGNEVLAKANKINAEHGFEATPRTGHQIGLDVHDYTMPYAPSFGPIETDGQPLKAGMTLTYEPGRRDPETGYRGHIEDIVLVTKGGPVCLNEMPYRVTW
ncbi:aminopeptidase P family protein [Candidatus Bathyarchaeota archaeon]|nr:aminopeptidase P family protein [Candidatus Bathyarchaeota archaeon]